jgi:hypothetical protein
VTDFQERRRLSMLELANDVLVSTVRDIIHSQGGSLTMTASELLCVLNVRVAPVDRPRDWPRAPNRLSGQIRALAPALRELGINVDLTQRRASDNNRLIKLWTDTVTSLARPEIPF